MRARRAARIALAALLVGAVLAFLASGLQRELSLANLQDQRSALEAYRDRHPGRLEAGYFLAYVAMAALSLPGAALLTLAGGALFGVVKGVLLVSFASSLGATLAFLASRFLLRDWVQARFDRPLRAVNEGIAREGGFYLFALRLIPAVPYFAINLAMGLTPMRTWTFYWVSQAGMLAGTVVYVNAGTQLAAIDAPADIFSPGLVGAFVLLGLFPLVARKIVDAARARRVYARWVHARPRRFDRNLVVIGAGAAGLVAAHVAAAAKARVTLVERDRMGGDCLYTGCVPSKALISAARLLARIRRHRDYGIRAASAELDFGEVMERVARVVHRIQPHDSAERYRALGVECLCGEARIVSPWEVQVSRADGSRLRLTTKSIVIAAGARPHVPPIPGIEATGYVTSDTLWRLRELPRRVLVLGGGPMGCELAQCLARLGAEVSLVEALGRILPREDPEVSALVAARFAKEGIVVLTGHEAREFRCEAGQKVLLAGHAGGEVRLAFDLLVCATGRLAHTAGYGLEELGIPLTSAGAVQTNEYLQTIYPNIYACGDVAGPYQYTHAASHQAWHAAVNALFGRLRRLRIDYAVLPSATFTDPEVARVGLNETEAKQKDIAYEVARYGFEELDRAIAEEEAHGFVKVLTVPGRDRLLGATIVGPHAGELIAELALAMRLGAGLDAILRTVHVYPTLGEANRHVASAWRRERFGPRQQALFAAWHDWSRGEGSARAVLGRLAGMALRPRSRAPGKR